MVDEGFLTLDQLSLALAEQDRTGRPLGKVLVELGFVSEGAVANALAEQHGGLLKTEFGISAGLGTHPGGAAPAAAKQLDPAARIQELELERDALARRVEELEAAVRPSVEWAELTLTPSANGYALVEFPGPAPPLGTLVNVDGIDFAVRQVGPSPLSGSGLRCAVLERVDV